MLVRECCADGQWTGPRRLNWSAGSGVFGYGHGKVVWAVQRMPLARLEVSRCAWHAVAPAGDPPPNVAPPESAPD